MTGRHVGALLVFASALAACEHACGKTPAGAPAPAASTTANAPPTWQVTLRARGVVGAIFRALPTLSLDEEQQATLTEIGRELSSARSSDAGSERAALKALLATLGEEVKAGNVDPAAWSAREAQLADSEAAARKSEAIALNGVQRVLKAEQRNVVADAVRATARAPQKSGDAGLIDRDAARPREVNWARERLASYVRGIGLDAAREAKIDAILNAEPMPADALEREAQQRAALLDAFEHDGFDANHFPVDAAHEGRTPFFRLVRFVAKVVPFLGADQNAKLAAKLTEPESRRRPSADDE